MVRSFMSYDKDSWKDHLIEFEVTYNALVHSTTAYTHFSINYGIHLKTVSAELIVSQKQPSVHEVLTNVVNP